MQAPGGSAHEGADPSIPYRASEADDIAIVHELQRLVRPCFRPCTRPDLRRDPHGSVAYLPDSYDPHALEMAMRAGAIAPSDFGLPDGPRLRRHAGSILAVALGLLLRDADAAAAAAWLALFAPQARPDDSSAPGLPLHFTPAQRFVVAMSLHVVARRLGRTEPGPHLRASAEDWRPETVAAR